MTEEELYREAKESFLKNKDKHFNLDEADYTEGYIDCAETQKKRIEELEKKIKKKRIN